MNLEQVTNALNNLQIRKTKYIYHVCTSGTIPAYKVARCMTNTTYIHNTTTPKNFTELTTLEIPTQTKYWVSIRNQQTCEEEIYNEPLNKKQAKKWCELFATSELFRNVNLHGKYSFPKLKLPDPEMELWDQTAFKINNDNFIATVVVNPTLSLQPSFDHVHFCLVSPWLPRTYTAFQNLTTSNSRKLVLYHEAVIALLSQDNVKITREHDNGPPPTATAAVAKARKGPGGSSSLSATAELEIKTKATEELRNYTLATTLHDQAIVDNAQWQYYKVQGAFLSSGIEKIAGTVVIEQLFSFLYPYLLLLEDTTESSTINGIEYTITQPSKFGYQFNITKFAGCKIFGAVNMCASEESLLNIMAHESSLPKSHSLIGPYHHSGRFASYLQNLSIHQLLQFSSFVESTIADVTDQFNKLRLAAPHNDPDYPLEDDTTKEIYTGEEFKIKMQYLGLRMIEKALSQITQTKEKLENTNTTDYFLTQLVQAHYKQAYSSNIDSKMWTVVVNSVISFLDSLIEDFIANVKKSESSLRPSTITSYLNTKVTAKTFTFEQGIGFIKACRGSPPQFWKSNMARELELSPDQFLKAVYYMPSLFKMFYHKVLFDAETVDEFIKNKLESYIAQNPITFEGSIFDTMIKLDGYSRNSNETRLKAALVFKIFSNGVDARGIHDWQWKD